MADATVKKERQTPHNPREIKNVTPQIARKLQVVDSNLDIIAPDADDLDFATLKADYADRKRVKYAALRAHQEIAATMIACGATYEMAGAQAGVSDRQIRKYMTDSDFRARVAELREKLTSQVHGAILNRFAELVSAGNIRNLEVMDLTRIFDRVVGTSQGGGRGGPVVNTGEGQERYDNFLQQITVVVNSGQSPDFPEFETTDVRLSEGSSPLDG